MKKKHWIILLVHLFLVVFLILHGNLLIKDIIFIYLVVLLPAVLLISLEYLVKRKVSYYLFLTDKLFTNFIMLALIFGLAFYSTETRYIQRDKAIEDLEFMQQSLENIHPDIYHVIPKDSFQIRYNRIINDLPGKITEAEFHRTCARLSSFFGTAHTVPTGNLLGKRMQFLFKNTFPYKTTIIENKLIVTGNLSLLYKIPVGSEILEINRRNVNQLIREWSMLVSYESDSYRNFLITRPLNIGIWNDFKSYRIRYRVPGSQEIREKQAKGGISSNMYSFLLYGKQKPTKLFLREISPKIAYIGFFDCHDLKHYEDFYQSTFRELKDKRIDNLIIDIRGNGGGHTRIGAEMMQYLFHQPFREEDSTWVKVSNELISTGKVDEQLGPGRKRVGNIYTLVREPYELRDNPLRFGGKTWLLTDNGTFSAGQVFASAYKCYGNGTIIGEETGGVTVSYGDVHIFNLPNSGLKMMTSWKRAFSACGKDDKHGIMPDYIISNSISDILEKKDRILDFTIDLINKQSLP